MPRRRSADNARILGIAERVLGVEAAPHDPGARLRAFHLFQPNKRIVVNGTTGRLPIRSATRFDAAARIVLDSTLENPGQKESDNRDWEEDVRLRADRRCVGWLCRRGDRRLRACWRGDDGWWGGGGSGCGRVGRRAVCGRRGRAGPPEGVSASLNLRWITQYLISAPTCCGCWKCGEIRRFVRYTVADEKGYSTYRHLCRHPSVGCPVEQSASRP